MLERNWKEYWLFYIIIGLFAVTLIFGAVFYTQWSKPVEENGVEVNLPIVEWMKYTNLSKQLPSDRMNQKNLP